MIWGYNTLMARTTNSVYLICYVTTVSKALDYCNVENIIEQQVFFRQVCWVLHGFRTAQTACNSLEVFPCGGQWADVLQVGIIFLEHDDVSVHELIKHFL